MMAQVAQRVQIPTFENRLIIYSDGNDDYQFTMPSFFRTDCIDYGQLVKIRKSGRVVDKIRRIVYGHPDRNDIETTNVENFNGILRERIGRLVRKTKCYGKNEQALAHSITIFQFYWNFMKPIREKLTPAMIEHQTTKRWTWGNLLHHTIKIP